MSEEITMTIRGAVGTYRVCFKDDGSPGPVYRKCYDATRDRRYETLCVGHGETARQVRNAIQKRMAA